MAPFPKNVFCLLVIARLLRKTCLLFLYIRTTTDISMSLLTQLAFSSKNFRNTLGSRPQNSLALVNTLLPYKKCISSNHVLQDIATNTNVRDYPKLYRRDLSAYTLLAYM